MRASSASPSKTWVAQHSPAALPGRERDVHQHHGTSWTPFLQEAALCKRSWCSEAIKMTDGEFLGGVWLLTSQAQELWALQAGSRCFSRRRHHHRSPDRVTPQPPEAGHGCAVMPGVCHTAPRGNSALGKAHSRAGVPAGAYACNWPGSSLQAVLQKQLQK